LKKISHIEFLHKLSDPDDNALRFDCARGAGGTESVIGNMLYRMYIRGERKGFSYTVLTSFPVKKQGLKV
jgi:hypothetical protein